MSADSNTRVLVTGGRGFIGQHLVRELVRSGHSVISVDLVPAPATASDTVEEVVADVRDTPLLKALLERASPAAIYDLASRTEVGLPESAYQGNIDATRSLMRVVRDLADTKYIFFSTQFVFRSPGRLPGSETEFEPVDSYGAAKAESERIIRSELGPGRFLILRPTYVWGPGLLRFRDGLLDRLGRGQLLISSDPQYRRYYGYVTTVARQAIEFARHDFARLPGSVFYLSDRAVDMRSFCDALIAALGRGRALAAPPAVIRFLGAMGELAARLGLPAPINAVQARELTTSYPVPVEPTIALTGVETDLAQAAYETVAWARRARAP